MSPAAYVEYGGRATAPPPFRSTEGTFRGLMLKGDALLIAQLVERYLNVPAAGAVVYRPLLGEWVLMQTGAFKKVSSEAPGFESWGYVDEAQISLWIPLAAGRLAGDHFVAERICMAVPYILVNNPMSYAGGREIYGYPKSLGIFDPPSAVGDPQKVEAFGGDFAAGSAAGWHPLFELRRVRASPGESAVLELGEALKALPGAWRELDLPLPQVSVIKDIFETLTGKQMRQVFLKQFRDEQVVGAACYQHVVEAPIDFLSTQIRPSLDEWELVVHHLDSHPVDVEMGIATQRTRLSFDVQMDFVAAAGEVVV